MLKYKTYFYLKNEKQTSFTYTSGRPYWVLDYYRNNMTLLDINGNEIKAKPNSVYLIPPGMPTKHISTKGGSWVHSTITFDADENYIEQFSIPPMTPICIKNPIELEELMFSMESCQLSGSRFKEESLNAYLLLILICIHNLLNTYSTDYRTNSGDDLQQIRHTIMNSTHINWTLDTMSTLANMSLRHFQRKYKETYGKTPIADLYDFRFTRSKRLLESGFSINHIINSCGFKSAQHFSSFFKKHAGCTPTEYKKQKK